MALTNTEIRKAKPGRKAVRFYDGSGLYLEVSPSGGKLWRWKYHFGGKEKRLGFGRYPDVPLASARKRREEARELLAEGVDPSAVRRAKKAERAEQFANNFEAIGREWFTKNSPNWAPSHADKIIKRLENDVFPWLAPMLFVRPGELRKARWANFDLDKAEWRYLVSKTKTDHLVPLSSQAVEILRELQAKTGHRDYVFPGRDPKKAMSEAAVNAALRRMGYDTKTEITGHGFRAMARTILHQELNFAPELIEHQLAHRVPDTLGTAYNRTKFVTQRRSMMQHWSDYLEELKAGARVIPIHGRSA